MPEGDSIYRAAKRLRAVLDGEVLTTTDFRVPALATVDLAGQRVDEVVSRGKHLLVRVGEHTIHGHLGMDGAWHVYGARERWRRPAHTARVLLSANESTVIGFSLKRLDVVRRDAEDEVVGHLGPDLLGPDWDAGEAGRRFARQSGRTISEVLMDQRVMAGVGNIYRTELCFLRGVHPDTPVEAAGDPARYIELARRLLWFNRDRSVRVTTGQTRRGREMWVYGRRGPCLRCGTEVRLDPEAERVTRWCPTCQPLRPAD